jgi:ribose 5-phosphate isomerase A
MDLAGRAFEFISDGQILGLGTGRAASAFVRVLGQRVKEGFNVRCVPTSRATAALAQELEIPLTTLKEVGQIDATVDGADEVDPHLDLIKGWGGALVREKIVAAASRRLVILVEAEKLVPVLGTRGSLPVEVVPFGLEFCRGELRKLGCDPVSRMEEGRPFQTDNGNYIIDCKISPLDKPWEWEQAARVIPGVIGTGLFLGMAHVVLVQDGEMIKVLKRENS